MKAANACCKSPEYSPVRLTGDTNAADRRSNAPVGDQIIQNVNGVRRRDIFQAVVKPRHGIASDAAGVDRGQVNYDLASIV